MFDKDPGFFLALNDEHDHTFKTIVSNSYLYTILSDVHIVFRSTKTSSHLAEHTSKATSTKSPRPFSKRCLILWAATKASALTSLMSLRMSSCASFRRKSVAYRSNQRRILVACISSAS
jgi:hypothetical protein